MRAWTRTTLSFGTGRSATVGALFGVSSKPLCLPVSVINSISLYIGMNRGGGRATFPLLGLSELGNTTFHFLNNPNLEGAMGNHNVTYAVFYTPYGKGFRGKDSSRGVAIPAYIPTGTGIRQQETQNPATVEGSGDRKNQTPAPGSLPAKCPVRHPARGCDH